MNFETGSDEFAGLTRGQVLPGSVGSISISCSRLVTTGGTISIGSCNLNGYRHFITIAMSQMASRVHFIHERGKGLSPIPLILTHGWPGSFVEMLGLFPC